MLPPRAPSDHGQGQRPRWDREWLKSLQRDKRSFACMEGGIRLSPATDPWPVQPLKHLVTAIDF